MVRAVRSSNRSVIRSPTGRQAGGPHVDNLSLDLQRHPAVLGNPPLRDIHISHNLQPGQQRRVYLPGRRHDVMEHAVNPETRPQVFS